MALLHKLVANAHDARVGALALRIVLRLGRRRTVAGKSIRSETRKKYSQNQIMSTESRNFGIKLDEFMDFTVRIQEWRPMQPMGLKFCESIHQSSGELLHSKNWQKFAIRSQSRNAEEIEKVNPTYE